MKRITISISVFLLFTSFAFNDAVAQRRKSLNQAVVEGKLDLIKTYFSEGADVNSKNDDGSTALSLAAEEGYTEIVELLINAGAVE